MTAEMLKNYTKLFVMAVRSTIEYDEKKRELMDMFAEYTGDIERWERQSICYDMNDFSYSIGWNVDNSYGISIAYADITESGEPTVHEKVFDWEMDD